MCPKNNEDMIALQHVFSMIAAGLRRSQQVSTHRTNFCGRELADYKGFKILNMFDRNSWPTITESVVQSADSVVES